MKRVLFMLAMAAACAGVAGCWAVAAGVGAAGTVTYLRGALRISFAEDVQAVHNASVKALDDLGIAVIEQRHDALTGRVTGRTTDDTKVTINIDRDVDVTVASIRYGTWGDEGKSRMIYERIRANL